MLTILRTPSEPSVRYQIHAGVEKQARIVLPRIVEDRLWAQVCDQIFNATRREVYRLIRNQLEAGNGERRDAN